MKNKLKLPVCLDSPDTPQIGIGLFYGFVTFFGAPFFVYFLMADLQDPQLLTWFEATYHILNLVVVLSIFREFLSDAFSFFWLDKKRIFLMIRIAVIVMLIYIGVVLVISAFTELPHVDNPALLILPVSELQVLFLGIDMLYYNPLLGLLCAVVFSPVIISCLFYTVSFVPAFNKWPWLGYVAVAALVAFFQIGNNVTGWDVTTEIILFVIQLPVHIIACWAYRRANNICAPILTLALANLLACCRLLWMIFIG